MNEANPIESGEVLVKRFEILEPIGTGGMATVYAAFDRKEGRQIALKVLAPTLSDNETAAARIRREGEILALLKHPAIVRFYESGKLDDGRIFLAMQLLEGETLRDSLASAKLPKETILQIIGETAQAVENAHQRGVVHRDLKPANIFLCNDGSTKLLDFGISKAFNKARLTITGQILGTPRYMSPEQLSGDPVDEKCDQYSLAAIAYECVAQRPAYAQTDPAKLVVAVMNGNVEKIRPEEMCGFSEAQIQTIYRGLHSNPKRRFSTIREFADAFGALQTKSGHAAASPSKTARQFVVPDHIRSLRSDTGPDADPLPNLPARTEAIFAKPYICLTLALVLLVATLFYFLLD